MARNPALWIRVPNGGTPDNPAVYTAIRDSLREISEAVRLLQGGTSVSSASVTKTSAASGGSYTNSGPNIYLPLAGGTMTGDIIMSANDIQDVGQLAIGTYAAVGVGLTVNATSYLYGNVGIGVSPTSNALEVTGTAKFNGLLVTAAPTTSSAGLRLPHGTAPSAPTNGDIWTTTTGLYARINGTTVGPFSAASGVYLPLAGGTMTGDIIMSANDIQDIGQLAIGTYAAVGVGLTVNATSYLFGDTGVGVSPSAGTKLYVSGTTRLGGNVGINTAPSTESLLVSGVTYLNGNTGVGITPSYRLHVDEAQTATTADYTFRLNTTVTPASASSALFAAAFTTATSTGANLTGTLYGENTTVTHNGTSTLSSVVGSGVALVLQNTGNVTSAYSYYVSPVSRTGAGTITTAYGLYISQQQVTGVTTGYGIYQSATGDSNILYGNTGIGVSPSAGVKLTVNGTSYLNGNVGINTAPSSQALVVSGEGYITSNTGIGIAPSYRLHVDDSITGTAFGAAAYINATVTPASASTASNLGTYSRVAVTGANMTGTIGGFRADFIHNATSNLTNMYGAAVLPELQNTGNVTNLFGFYVFGLNRTGAGTVTNSYGLYISGQTVTGVTTGYGIYQASTSDKNILAGNVRIGSTTTATNALDVTGAATVSGNFAVDTDTLFVDAASNEVGIGTTGPQQKLDVAGTLIVTGNSDMPASAGTNVRITGGYASPDIGRIFIGDGTGWKLHFSSRTSSTNTDRVTFTDAGRVGIGATTPGVRLDVSETLAVASSSTFSAAAIRMNPVYTATGTITVKHRYIHFTQPTISGGTPTFTDAHTMYFDAAAGTHRAVDAGTTKTTPGTVNAWVKIDINGTTYYIPAYTSKTA